MGDGTLPPSPEDDYRSIYFEAIDTVTACIKNRFKQEGCQMYCRVEQLLIEEEQQEEYEVLKFYGSDFEKETLKTQLSLFHANYPSTARTCIHDVASLVRGMSVGERALMSQVVKIICLLLDMPATNAISERPFSAMCCIKSYLRSTMPRQLNATMVLHIHKKLTDNLDLNSIAKEFISKSDYRKSKFLLL